MTCVSVMDVSNHIIRRYSTYLTGGIRILYRVTFTKESSRLLMRRIGKMNNTTKVMILAYASEPDKDYNYDGDEVVYKGKRYWVCLRDETVRFLGIVKETE